MEAKRSPSFNISNSDDLQLLKSSNHIILNGSRRIFTTMELLTNDILIQFHISISNIRNHRRSHLRHLLPPLPLKTISHQPLTNKFLRQLLLTLTPSQTLSIPLSIIIPRRIRRMDLIHQINPTILLTKLILSIHKDKPHLPSNFLPPLINSPSILLHLLIILTTHKPLSNNLLLRNILIVTRSSLRRRSNKRLRELLPLNHPIRHKTTTQNPLPILILPPSVTSKITPDHHLHLKRLTLITNSHIRIRHSHLPIWQDILSRIQKLSSNKIQNLPLIWNALRQNHIKRRNSISHHHYQVLAVYIIDITNFANIFPNLSRKRKIGL